MKIKSEIKEGERRVFLQGSIAESAEDELDELREIIDGKEVEIDCGGISYINSIGMAAWMGFIKGVDSKRFVFSNCSIVFVEYLNLIAGIVGNGRVKSVQLPCRCDKCDQEVVAVVDVGSMGNDGLGDDFGACQKCKEPLKIDVDEDEYLFFAS